MNVKISRFAYVCFSNVTEKRVSLLEVVGRGSETQLQVGEILNYFISRIEISILENCNIYNGRGLMT